MIDLSKRAAGAHTTEAHTTEAHTWNAEQVGAYLAHHLVLLLDNDKAAHDRAVNWGRRISSVDAAGEWFAKRFAGLAVAVSCGKYEYDPSRRAMIECVRELLRQVLADVDWVEVARHYQAKADEVRA